MFSEQLSLFDMAYAKKPVANQRAIISPETTEERLHRVLADCMFMCEEAGIELGVITGIVVNSNLHYAWGRCIVNLLTSTSYIEINKALLDPSVPEVSLRNTILHELCHSVKNGSGHKRGWKRAADLLFYKYGIRLSVRNTRESLGVNIDDLDDAVKPKYLFKCEKCGSVVSFYRKTKFVQHPDHYRCGRCHGEFVKIENI